jgi:hypothetical protein
MPGHTNKKPKRRRVKRRPLMKTVKSSVTKGQQKSINRISDPKKKAYIKRRMLMGDTMAQAKKNYAKKEKLS